MWPEGMEGLEFCCWTTFSDADFQRRGPNGEKHVDILYSTKSVAILNPYKPNNMVNKNVLNFHLLGTKHISH